MNVRMPVLMASIPLLLAAADPRSDWQHKTLSAAAPYIDKANEEWTRAIVVGDAGILSAPYDENGLFIGPDGQVVRGKDSVRAMYAKRPTQVQVLKAWIKSDGRAAHDADDVYEWGTAQMLVRSGKTTRRSSGRYLTVWHRQGADWRITRNIAF